jgi:hypothetical protein
MSSVQRHVVSLCVLAVVAVLPAASAHAAKLTLGSDLSAAATQIEAQGQDTAIWSTFVKGVRQVVPADGQVTSVTVKGSALSEAGGAPPATMVHFQSLVPEGRSGAMRVWLSSQAFDLPIDNPGAVTTYIPENLCIMQGGVLGFNDIGGFQWGGSLDAPLDPEHYLNGVPYQIYAPVANSVTARFSYHNGTNNGDVLNPAAGDDPGRANGAVYRGRELLMQYTVATGDDRSEPCGGPRRHPDGTLVAPKVRELRVAGGNQQRPYVTRDRRFNVGVFCESPDAGCSGTAVLSRGKKTIKTVKDIEVGAQTSGKVPFRLGPGLFRTLKKNKSLLVTVTLMSQFGITTTELSLKR